MGSKDDQRWRDEFPQLFAAWMMTQSAARRATSQARENSSWTLVLVSLGGVIFLWSVLMFVDPSPHKAADASEAQPPLSFGALGRAANPLTLEVAWLQTASEWEDHPPAQWKSESPTIETVSFATAQADGWTAQYPRHAMAATGAPEPYWMRVVPIRFEDLTAALESQETPRRFAVSDFDGNVNVTIDRGPATLSDTGALTYTLHVQNLGQGSVEHVRVIETLPFPEYVTDTSPPAAMTQDGAFIWELSNLRGFETRDITMALDASQIRAPLETVAALDIETQVSVQTRVIAAALPPSASEPITPELALPEPESVSEPISPLLADDLPPTSPDWAPYNPEDAVPIEPLFTQDVAPAQVEEFTPLPAEDVQRFEPIVPEFTPDEPLPRDIAEEPRAPIPAHAPRPLPLGTQKPRPVLTLEGSSRDAVRTGDVVTTVYEIVNAGDVPAEGVVLTVFLPPELQHKHGEQVEHRIDRLLPGQSHSARLLTRASSTGTARLDAILSVEGEAEDENVLSVRVLGPRPANPPRQSP